MGSGHPATVWSTRQIAPASQFARWREAVSETHLAWDLPRRRQTTFSARLRQQPVGGTNVVECICEPCAGRRGTAELGRSTEAYYGVLHLLRGREMVRQAGREAWLAAGDFTLWDSTRPIDFAIGEPLHKITLLVPQRLLDAVLPRAHDRVATAVAGRSGAGALFTRHLRSLAREGRHVPNASAPAVVDATLELLASSLAAEEPSLGSPHRQALLARIKAFIDARLDDPALGPTLVAAAHGISVRQLHRIFEVTEITVERWIWQQRLTRCRHELLLPGSSPVSQIAFRWGFNDAAHFSRAFRERFGLSPRELRKQARPVRPDA